MHQDCDTFVVFAHAKFQPNKVPMNVGQEDQMNLHLKLKLWKSHRGDWKAAGEIEVRGLDLINGWQRGTNRADLRMCTKCTRKQARRKGTGKWLEYRDQVR